MQVKRVVIASALALTAAVVSPAALAQACGGFTDISASPPGDPELCASVEWMKNRGVTLGCGGGLYCPNNNVLRSEMARFMKRLGDKLTPEFVRKRDTPPAPNFTATQNVCATDPIAVAAYPRRAIVRGMLNLFTPNGGMDIEARIVYSTDGINWQTPATMDGFAYGTLYDTFSPAMDITLNPYNAIDMDTVSTYQFAIQAIKKGATGSGTIANVYCENLVQIVNRNTTTPPLDAFIDPGPAGRGD